MAKRMAVLALALTAGCVTAGSIVLNGFDVSDGLISSYEISEGAHREGIAALTDPPVVAALDATHMRDADRVLALEINGEARAYPIRIMNWHEVVNDELGGVPVAVTYSPLCGSGVAFDRRVGGDTLTFGVSGLLYNNNTLMYDFASNALWSQLGAVAVTGPKRGSALTVLPVVETTWFYWRSVDPVNRTVLAEPSGYGHDYASDHYSDYAASTQIHFPVQSRDRRFHPKNPVYGVMVGADALAFPLDELKQVNGRQMALVGGRAVYIEHTSMSDEIYASVDGAAIAGVRAYWFAWSAFHPETRVFRASGGKMQ